MSIQLLIFYITNQTFLKTDIRLSDIKILIVIAIINKLDKAPFKEKYINIQISNRKYT
jgi:hypothetical protein